MATVKTTVKKSSDKTSYREEEQEVSYQRRWRATSDMELEDKFDDKFDDLFKQKGSFNLKEQHWDDVTDPSFEMTYTTYKSTDVTSRAPSRQPSGWTNRTVVLVLLLAAAVSAGIYLYVMGDQTH